MADLHFKKTPLNLEREREVTRVVSNVAAQIFRMNLPIASQIAEIVRIFTDIKEAPNPEAREAKIAEGETRAKSLEITHETTTALQGQIIEATPILVEPAVHPLPPVPTSTNKAPFESKKFIAMIAGVAALLLSPMLTALGVSAEEASKISTGIIAIVGVYLTAQGVTDAVAAKKDGPPAQ